VSAPRPPLGVVTGAAVSERARPPIELAALGTGLVITTVLLARLDSWRDQLGTFQSLFAVAFVFYALALLQRRRDAGAPHLGLTVLAVAAAARLALLPVTPTLSDDLYRYVWEGRVAAAGHDPWRSSPLDPALAPLRDRVIHPRLNHPELASIYPPLAVAGFALVARVSPTLWAFKAWVMLHDLALVAVLMMWLRRLGLGPLPAIAYAWNPLVLVEFAGSGHNDPTAMLWLVVALAIAERRPVAAALALTVGTLVKLAPLAALPFLLRRWPWRARLVALASLAAGLGWFWSLTRGADSGLTAYWRTWRNNELAFHYLAAWLGDPMARAAALAIVAAVAVLALRHARRAGPRMAADDAGHGTRAVLRAGLLVSPVAHPWYFAWPLVLEPLGPSAPWILLSFTCVLSYGLLAPPPEGGAYHLPLIWRWVEYGVPLALGIVLALGARARSAGRS
jgi:alpha-1,6-mannosyltransferase